MLTSRGEALRLARRLLALARVPPGAVPTGSTPPSLSGPVLGIPVMSTLVDEAHFWRVPMSFATALGWERRYPPHGFAEWGSSTGSQPGYRTGGLGFTVSTASSRSAWSPPGGHERDPG